MSEKRTPYQLSPLHLLNAPKKGRPPKGGFLYDSTKRVVWGVGVNLVFRPHKKRASSIRLFLFPPLAVEKSSAGSCPCRMRRARNARAPAANPAMLACPWERKGFGILLFAWPAWPAWPASKVVPKGSCRDSSGSNSMRWRAKKRLSKLTYPTRGTRTRIQAFCKGHKQFVPFPFSNSCAVVASG